MEHTKSIFMFSVAMMVVKKVLKTNFTKGNQKLMSMINFLLMNWR